MYIIGDVHGCYKTFKALIEKLPKDEIVILTGDIIDRGPQSKEIIQWMIDNSNKCKSVIGNHEQMLLNVRKRTNMSNVSMWTWNGGDATLDSYFPKINNCNLNEEEYGNNLEIIKKRRCADIPKDHLTFMENLPLYIEEEKVLISHTCWNTEIPWDNVKDLDDNYGYFGGLTWYRGTPGRLPKNKFHIFGHTPVPEPEITDYYANVDTGAAFVKWDKGGFLTALHYPTMEIIQQKNIDFPAEKI